VIVLGARPFPRINGFNLIFGSPAVAGSIIGGLPDTQEMLDFCTGNGIAPDIELIREHPIIEAWTTLAKGDVAHRYVMDMSSVGAAA
jgi:uncharacterized zinc-type alcohol dehydrogenase-like protein